MTPGEPEDPYYRSVEEEFLRRRGAAMLLSPRDWSLIGEWKDAGIPLRVVLQAINNIFDAFERRAPAGRRINSLAYCRQEVQSLHDLYLTLHAVEAGRPQPSTDPSGVAAATRHLGRLARRVRTAMAIASRAARDPLVASLARAAAELKRLRQEIKKGELDPHSLEDLLRSLDEEILSAARRSLPAEETSRLEAAAESAIGRAAERMTRDAKERTHRAHLARLLRDSAEIPRLTLFD